MKRFSFIFLVFLIILLSITPTLKVKSSPDTFGETSQGGNLQNLENSIRGSPFTCPQAGTGVSITAWLEVVTTSHLVKCRLYYPNGSIVINGDTEEKTVNVGADQEITFDFNTGPTLANEDYVIVAWAEGITGTCKMYSFSETNRMRQDNEAYNSWPDPATFTTYHQRCSIYCTYTPSVGEEKNFSGSINVNVNVDSSKAFSFDFHSWINPIFSIDSEKAVSFSLIKIVNPSFKINSLAHFIIPGLVNLFGSINVIFDVDGWTDLALPIQYATEEFVLYIVFGFGIILMIFLFLFYLTRK